MYGHNKSTALPASILTELINTDYILAKSEDKFGDYGHKLI
jgi:hypothetical protein